MSSDTTRHVRAAALGAVGIPLVLTVRPSLLVSPALYVGLIALAVFVTILAYRAWPGRTAGWRLDARILASVVPIGALTYLTGWGAALVPVQLFAVADNVRHGGLPTLRRSLGWVAAATLAGELAVGTGMLASAIPTVTSHALAGIGVFGVLLVGAEIARSATERDAAEAARARSDDERRWLRDELSWQSRHDPISGLANRAAGLDALDEALRTRPGDEHVTLLLVEVMGLAQLADARGPGSAAQVVAELGRRLAGCDDAAYVSRHGPDAFLVLAPDGTDHSGAYRLARLLLAAVRLPVETASQPIHPLGNVGIASSPAGTPVADALAAAEIALSAARSAGPDRIEVYTADEHVTLAERLALATDLRAAIVGQQFAIEFQPIVDLGTGRMVSVEALVRWDHPTRGRLSPELFIDEAERTGHVTALGRFVLEEAVWQATSWWREFHADAPSVSVNVSARQLDDRLLDTVEDLLDETMLPAHLLTLELTETAMAPGGEAALRRRLDDLHALGINLALDDFGTGYSSLAYVERLPLQILKIDRSFVTSTDDEVPSVARAMIELARALRLTTVVEGIETTEQRDRFARLGCERAQGYLFSRPVAAEAITTQLRRRAARAPA